MKSLTGSTDGTIHVVSQKSDYFNNGLVYKMVEIRPDFDIYYSVSVNEKIFINN
jgi:hypothetical protein